MSTAIGSQVSSIAAEPAEAPQPYLSLHSVTIFVRDQERSLRFYLDHLGFELAFDAQVQSGRRWVAVRPPDGGAVLMLVAPNPGTEEYQLIGRPTQIVFVTEDVTAKFREWRRKGVRFLNTPRLRRMRLQESGGPGGTSGSQMQQPGAAPIWGGVFARFEDLDGNSFGLVGFDEVNKRIEAQRRANAEKAESERRLARDLEIAKEVQAGLFPRNMPSLKTLDYAGICIQARQVGGDYYDFLNLGQERLGLVIGDIAGKGMAAALLMANLQANLRSQCATAVEHPQRFLQSVNQLFYENTRESSYATLFFAEYCDRSRNLRYVNCGHLCGLVVRESGLVERLDSTCTVLGLFREWDCSVGECNLVCGDTLALYTDGITESFNAAGEDFGEHRLIEALKRYRRLPSQDVLGMIAEEVRQYSPHEQHDDITLIVAKCVVN